MQLGTYVGTSFIHHQYIKTAKIVADMLETAALRGLDAPVSGGVGGATAGSLTFMVGGDEDTLALARPLFEIMGQRVIHCGDAGAGQSAKICNNLILGHSSKTP